MNNKVFSTIGWVILLGIVVLRFGLGYKEWNLLLLPIAYIFFSIGNGSIKKLKKVKMLSVPQIIGIVFVFSSYA